jgi:integrase
LPADLKKGLSIATENMLEMSESQRLQFEGGKSFGREKSNQQSSWALGSVIKFLQMTKARVERKEITAATLLNSVKVIKLFCEMNDVLLPWKRITRGLPRARRYADDRAPTLEEIQKIVEYPDKRIKAIVSTMASSGMRLGAWNYLKWKHITPINKDGKIVAAKIVLYQGDPEQYFSFITREAFFELEKWVSYRKAWGESVTEESWLMRNRLDRNKGSKRKPGTITNPKKLQSFRKEFLIRYNIRNGKP